MTAFKADMTRRLESLKVHAISFDERLNTIHQGITTLNERSTTANARLSAIRQSLATANSHPINLNRRLDTIDKSFTGVKGQMTTISQGPYGAQREICYCRQLAEYHPPERY
jgi:chromosome segregation ATPase